MEKLKLVKKQEYLTLFHKYSFYAIENQLPNDGCKTGCAIS
jgi:hypothetical protein